MRKVVTYKIYDIHPGFMPIDVQIIVGGVSRGIVSQGYNPSFSITRHKGDHFLDVPYRVNETCGSQQEAEDRAMQIAKDIIDGKVEGVNPPD